MSKLLPVLLIDLTPFLMLGLLVLTGRHYTRKARRAWEARADRRRLGR